jgi:hypothetical protein
MRALRIEPREQTPLVILDKENSKLEIRGYSLPDSAHEFYDDVIVWFKEYAKDPNPETTVIFDFYYVNSTSAKFINDILKVLDGINATGKTASVEWFFDSDDEDIEQLGIVLKEFHKVPFTISPKFTRTEIGSSSQNLV